MASWRMMGMMKPMLHHEACSRLSRFYLKSERASQAADPLSIKEACAKKHFWAAKRGGMNRLVSRTKANICSIFCDLGRYGLEKTDPHPSPLRIMVKL
jgi:hypothetical protein